MKHITRRRPDSEVRLGTWKVLILHRASSRPVSGGPLHQDLTRQGYRIFLSTLHQALLGMQRNGMLKSDDVGWGKRRQFHITKKGRQHLAALRRELSSAYDEVVRGIGPADSPRLQAPSTNASQGDIVAAVLRSEREREQLRAALERIQTVIAAALG